MLQQQKKAPDIAIPSNTPSGGHRSTEGVEDIIEMSGVFSAAATDVLALDATDVFSADATDVLSAAKAASGGSCPANLGFRGQLPPAENPPEN